MLGDDGEALANTVDAEVDRFLAKNFLVSEIFLPFVETISPFSKKKSVMLIA